MNYSEKDLVEFGNYLLSKERDDNFIGRTDKRQVWHSDLENWRVAND